MAEFRKTRRCPSSLELLNLDDAAGTARAEEVRLHLASCEFCSAEFGFYQRHPQRDERVRAGEIPAPLRELAEALMSPGQSDRGSLDKLLGEARNRG